MVVKLENSTTALDMQQAAHAHGDDAIVVTYSSSIYQQNSKDKAALFQGQAPNNIIDLEDHKGLQERAADSG